MCAATPLAHHFHVASAVCYAAYSYANLYDGPPIGDNPDFQAFINQRWAEARARGHGEMVISEYQLPSDDDIGGYIADLDAALGAGDYARGADVLDRVDDQFDEIMLRAMKRTARVVFSCKQCEGVHHTMCAWRPNPHTVTVLTPKTVAAQDGAAQDGAA